MKHPLKQAGQSMAEYTVVVVALVSGLLIANEGCTKYDNCIEAVLVAMHDNYSGYAGSMSSVHEYATDFEASDNSSSWGDDTDDDSDSGGSGSGGTDVTGLSTVTSVTSGAGFYDYGYLQSDGSVTATSDSDSDIQGYYDSDTGEFTDADTGVATAVDTDERVIDEDGNVLQMHAFTACSGSPAEVYGFGYQSEATGTYYDTSFDEQDLDSNCWQPSYKALQTDGTDSGGRIVDGNFYAVTATPYSDTPITPTGEVVYWDFGSLDGDVYQTDADGDYVLDDDGEKIVAIDSGSAVSECAVMIYGWDDSVDTSQSDEKIFEDQLQLYSDAKFGTQDSEYYVEQTVLYGESSSPWSSRGDCVTQRVLTNP